MKLPLARWLRAPGIFPCLNDCSTVRRRTPFRLRIGLISTFLLFTGYSALAVDYVVQADGAGGAYTSVNAAIAAAVSAGPSGKIIEIRANTLGGTQVLAQNIDLSAVSVSSTNEENWLTIRVRESDTIRFRTTGSLLTAGGTSKGWRVEGNSSGPSSLQFGDRADFVCNANNSYETCYPQERGADIASTVSNYAVRRAQFTGASNYFANWFDGSDYWLEDIAAYDHGTNYYEIHPTKGTPNDWGDLVTVRGVRANLRRLTGLHGGHNGWGFICRSSVVRDSDFSGYWGDISPASAPGARALIVEGVRNTAPYGPILIEGTVIRDSGDSVDETHQALMKTEATQLVMRDNFFWDSDSHLWHQNFTNATDSSAVYFSYGAFYHNTTYISKGTWWNNISNYNSASGDAQFEENLIANNLFQQVSDNDKYTNSAQILRYDTRQIGLNGWANAFHGTVISGNAIGGPSSLKQISVENSSAANVFGITSVPTAFQGNVYENDLTEVTFANVGSFRSRTKAGFAVSDWGSGASAGDAPPLTTITMSSSGTTIEVDNARPFFDGWSLRGEVGDYIYIGSTAAAAVSAGAVQIYSIDYVNHEITLTASRSVTSGEGLWFGGNPANGSAAIRSDRGARIPSSGSPPSAPSLLSATTVSSSAIDLSWTDNASDETVFKIERKTGSGGTFSQIDTVTANSTSYSDTGLSASTTYYYRIAAANGAGSSSWSNTDDTTTSAGGGGGSTDTTFSPTHDAYLQGSTRYNTSELRVENSNRVSYLQFDISSLSGTVTAAILRLTTSADDGNGTFRVFLGDSNSWTESSLSTGNAPSSTGEVGNRSGTFAAQTTYDWSLSGAVSGNGTISLIIMHDSGGNDVSFHSDEASLAAALKPQLIVTTSGSTNTPPTVSLTTPADESTYVLGEPVNLTATATDTDGIALVEFHHTGSTLIDDDSTSPYTAVWNPSSTGSYVLTAKAYDGGSPMADATSAGVDVEVVSNSVPSITTSTLPDGEVGTAYSQSLATTGGNGSLTWSLESGSLPAGLSLSSGGTISGTPTTSGAASFTVRVADADGNTGGSDEDTQALALTVLGTPTDATFYASHDAYLQGSTRVNDSALRVEYNNRLSYLQFNVSGLSGTVTAVKLRLTTSTDYGNGTFRVFLGNSNSWTETTLSTGIAPGSVGEVGSRSGTFDQNTTYDWTLSGAVSGNGTISLIIAQDSGGNDVSFHSDEASVSASLKPQLIVTTQ